MHFTYLTKTMVSGSVAFAVVTGLEIWEARTSQLAGLFVFLLVFLLMVIFKSLPDRLELRRKMMRGLQYTTRDGLSVRPVPGSETGIYTCRDDGDEEHYSLARGLDIVEVDSSGRHRLSDSRVLALRKDVSR